MKKTVGLIWGLIAFVLLIPSIIMVFSNTSGWNFAAVLLTILVLAAAALAIIASIFSISGRSNASLFFMCAGIGAVLVLALTLFLAMSFDITIITAAVSAIILFIVSRVVKTTIS